MADSGFTNMSSKAGCRAGNSPASYWPVVQNKLTERFIENLKAPCSGRLEIFDTLLLGFGVREEPRQAFRLASGGADPKLDAIRRSKTQFRNP